LNNQQPSAARTTFVESPTLPTFSVIIATYNNAPTLARAIASVLAQTHAAHEIIVIDDGSTDHTAEVVQPFGDRIVYVHQPNAGVAAARNKGVEIATGNWLAFLDADDEFTPERLALHADWIRVEPDLDFVVSDQEACEPDGKYVCLFLAGCTSGGKLLAKQPGAQRIRIEEADFEDLIGDGFMETRTMSMPRAAFLRLGGFSVEHKVGEDLHLFIRLLAESKKGGMVPQVVAKYYIYPTSTLRKDPVVAEARYAAALESLAPLLRRASTPVRRGYRAKRHVVRMRAAMLYLRTGRRREAFRMVLPSLFDSFSLSTAHDVISIARGWPKPRKARSRSV
jgi:glycosyltransferase involved in cell wall biosynthesis